MPIPVPSLSAPLLPDRPAAALRLPRIESAPRIDGDISDPVWKTALRADGFVRYGGDGPVSERTEVWLATDGRSLYLAIHCHDARPDLIRASETQRGGAAVADDDHIQIRIDSQHTHRGYSTFTVNARGTQTEALEGGTGPNWLWSGSWRAATHRVADGWTCEVEIPWRLLRYPRGASGFAMAVLRRIARETNPVVWPPVPREGQTEASLAQFLPNFDAPPLPDNPPRPVLLPFVLNTVANGAGLRSRQGIDVKVPFSTTLTGVLALRPDFQTIENDVAQINFSYNEVRVRDFRPFFAEGAEFMPDVDLFYSRRITGVDDGLKLVGRSGNQTVGFVAAHNASGSADRTSAALRVDQAFSPLSRLGVAATADNRSGYASNRVARAFGEWGRMVGRRTVSLSGHQSMSWQGSERKGDASELALVVRDVPGRPVFRLKTTTLDADFVSDLGLLVDRNRRSWEGKVSQSYRYDRGPLELYVVEGTYSRAQRQTGGFFYESLLGTVYVQNRRGYGFNLGNLTQRRQQLVAGPRYNDRVDHVAVVWNRRNLFTPGGLAFDTGRQQGKRFRFVQVEQGVLVNAPLSLKVSHSVQTLGAAVTRQTILTGVYRLDEARAISCRLVSQNGTGNAANVAGQAGTNVYLAYGQRSRGGTDVFVLLGDPNAADTRSQLTVKLLRPY